MVKPQNKNTVPTLFFNSFKKWPKKPRFWVALAGALIIFVVLGLLAVRQIKINTEKRDFLQKQSLIHDLGHNLRTEYPATHQSEKQFCEYQSRKYEKGDLYCAVSLTMIYANLTISESNEIAKQFAESNGIKIRQSGDFSNINTFLGNSGLANKQETLVGRIPGKSNDIFVSFYYDTGYRSDKELSVVLTYKKPAFKQYFSIEE